MAEHNYSSDSPVSTEEVFSAETIIDAITRLNGQLPEILDEFPSRYENKDLSVLMEQFLWIHNYVLNESKDDTEE